MRAHLELLNPTCISLDDPLKNYASLALGKVLDPVEESLIVLKCFFQNSVFGNLSEIKFCGMKRSKDKLDQLTAKVAHKNNLFVVKVRLLCKPDQEARLSKREFRFVRRESRGAKEYLPVFLEIWDVCYLLAHSLYRMGVSYKDMVKNTDGNHWHLGKHLSDF